MKEFLDRFFERNRLNQRLHWTTIVSEKVLLAIIGLLSVIASAQYIWGMFEAGEITLADLFLLFIYVEIIGMIGAFYSTNRIPVTLPIIIAITALCRLIIMQSKDMQALTLIAEAGAVLILSAAAYLMSLKDKLSQDKLVEENRIVEQDDEIDKIEKKQKTSQNILKNGKSEKYVRQFIIFPITVGTFDSRI